MGRKQLMSEKIIHLSNQLGISKKDIKLTLCSFIIYKQRELLNGREIRIADLVEIVPEPLYDSTITTLAFVAKEISSVHGFSYIAVKETLDTYIRIQRGQIRQGRAIDFRGLVKIHPKIENGLIKAVHSCVSAVITNEVITENRLQRVRVHTAKSMKQEVYGLPVSRLSEEELDDDLITDEDVALVFSPS